MREHMDLGTTWWNHSPVDREKLLRPVIVEESEHASQSTEKKNKLLVVPTLLDYTTHAKLTQICQIPQAIRQRAQESVVFEVGRPQVRQYRNVGRDGSCEMVAFEPQKSQIGEWPHGV